MAADSPASAWLGRRCVRYALLSMPPKLRVLAEELMTKTEPRAATDARQHSARRARRLRRKTLTALRPRLLCRLCWRVTGVIFLLADLDPGAVLFHRPGAQSGAVRPLILSLTVVIMLSLQLVLLEPVLVLRKRVHQAMTIPSRSRTRARRALAARAGRSCCGSRSTAGGGVSASDLAGPVPG